MQLRDYNLGRSILARLDYDSEILESITSIAEKLSIDIGAFTAIGALKSAQLGYYDQDSHQYRSIEIDHPVEIASLTGNISIRDSRPFVHAHAVLADSAGKATAGHLQKGRIFAAELYLQELRGELLVRVHDPVTDLYLWD